MADRQIISAAEVKYFLHVKITFSEVFVDAKSRQVRCPEPRSRSVIQNVNCIRKTL